MVHSPHVLVVCKSCRRSVYMMFSGTRSSFNGKGIVMARPLVSDELWARIEPLLPKHHSPGLEGGRPPVDDRAALTGILFVLKSGIPWELLPQEMHCGCGMTCWRRLRDWQASGVWDKLLQILLCELRGADKKTARRLDEYLKTGEYPLVRSAKGIGASAIWNGRVLAPAEARTKLGLRGG